jgi:hypothetical protein
MRAFAVTALLLLFVGCQEKPAPTGKSGTPGDAGVQTKQPTSTPAKAEPLGEPVATIGATDLWQEYGQNALQADQKYKGKTVRIKGGVGKIWPDESGRYMIGLMAPEPGAATDAELSRMSAQERQWFNDGYPPNVIGNIADEAKDHFAALKSGSPVEVLGVCKGMTKTRDVWKGYIVTIDRCILAK